MYKVSSVKVDGKDAAIARASAVPYELDAIFANLNKLGLAVKANTKQFGDEVKIEILLRNVNGSL